MLNFFFYVSFIQLIQVYCWKLEKGVATKETNAHNIFLQSFVFLPHRITVNIFVFCYLFFYCSDIILYWFLVRHSGWTTIFFTKFLPPIVWCFVSHSCISYIYICVLHIHKFIETCCFKILQYVLIYHQFILKIFFSHEW